MNDIRKENGGDLSAEWRGSYLKLIDTDAMVLENAVWLSKNLRNLKIDLPPMMK